ncbi:hypothetical protein MRX96_000259 [Rhipicephalus microplus]
MLRSSSIYSPRLHSVPRLTDQQPASLCGSTPARVRVPNAPPTPTFWPVKRRPPPEEVWILQTSQISSSSTSATAINRQHPGAPLCGLGGCATKQYCNPVLFAMQVYATLVIHLLSSASLGAATDGPAAREPLWLDTSADITNFIFIDISNSYKAAAYRRATLWARWLRNETVL